MTEYCSSNHMSVVTADCSLDLENVQYYAYGVCSGAVVEALGYKLEGHGIDSRWCHWNFSLTKSFQPHYGPGVDSASNRNEYQEYFLGVKAAGA
jgi:hypothetical protein